METQAHYIRVGFFVIFFTSLFLLGTIWLSIGFNRVNYKYYSVYMHESVAGLSYKAPVKYNGVEVGYVKTIKLYTLEPGVVLLTLAIDTKVPIYTNTLAVLETQGLTGVAYIGLRGGSKTAQLLKKKPKQVFPVIRSGHSLFFRLDNALTKLTKNMNNISASLRVVVTPHNAEALSDIIQNLQSVSTNLKQNTTRLDTIMQNTAHASQGLPALLNTIRKSAKTVETITEKMANAGQAAQQTLQTASVIVSNINTQILPQVQLSADNLQVALGQIKELTQTLNENPAVLLRGKAAPTPGPGEEG